MRRRQILFITLIIVPILFIVVYLLYNKDPKINWEEHYREKGKDPFGTYVIKELLQDYSSKFIEIKNDPIHKTIIPNKENNANYVFIGSDLFLSKTDIDSLVKFVNKGNRAFISSKNFPKELIDTLFPNQCSEWQGHYSHNDSIVRLNFYHPDLEKKEGYVFKTPNKGSDTARMYNWQGVNGAFFCDSLIKTTNIGFIKGNNGGSYVNFIEFNYGKGKIFLHTSPIVFTNYYLTSKSNVEYIEKTLSHLNNGTIYWDEYSKIQYTGDDDTKRASPIKLILENNSLRFAWYLSIGLIILYILFYAKRKQRSIELQDEKVNTSLEFIKTIGTLYYQQDNHRYLMRLKLQLFFNFIRQRYSISTSQINQELTKRIALKSSRPENEVDSIIQEVKIINRYDMQIELDDLVRLHNLLDHFYKNCK